MSREAEPAAVRVTTSPSVIEGWAGPASQVGVSFAAATVMVATVPLGATLAVPLSVVPPLSVMSVMVMTRSAAVGDWSVFS